jgi:threonine/homoserine/homoserine lactone efflux protein
LVFAAFLLKVVLLSLSGVLAPGPITAVTVAHGGRSASAGAKVAVGHGLVEFPLIVGIFLGFEYLLKTAEVRGAIGVIGGLFLLFMSYGMFRSIKNGGVTPAIGFQSPVVAGAVLSITSPYFLIWWVTVGASLIVASQEFGLIGFVAMAICHWLCDLVWYSFLSNLSFRSGKFFGNRFQQIVFAVCGVFLIIMGAKFIVDAAQLLS